MRFDLDDKRQYADGLLRSLPYHCRVIMELSERLESIADELRGTVKSPSIKNVEIAKCQSGTRIYNNNIAEIIVEEAETVERLKNSEHAYYEIADFLQKLDEEELRLIIFYYEYNFSYEQIGNRLHMSRWTVKRNIDRALKKI